MSTQAVDSTGQDTDVVRAANRKRLERLAFKRMVPLVLRFMDAFTKRIREWLASESERRQQNVSENEVELLPPDADLLDSYAAWVATCR